VRDDPGQRLAEALRAQAAGSASRSHPLPVPSRASRWGRQAGWSLLIALLVGGVLGTALALLSLLVPGLLPELG